MRKKSDVELRRAAIIKSLRSLIRLKHSLAADRELNEVLPEKLAEFDNAHLEGRVLALKADISELFDGGLRCS